MVPLLDDQDLAEEGPTDPMHGITAQLRGLPERRLKGRQGIAHQVRFAGRSCCAPAIGRVSDLSTGGMFIHTPRTLRPGHHVGGTLRPDVLSNARPLAFEGEVVWSTTYDSPYATQGPGFGIKFTKLTANARKRIEELVEQQRTPLSRRITF